MVATGQRLEAGQCIIDASLNSTGNDVLAPLAICGRVQRLPIFARMPPNTRASFHVEAGKPGAETL